MKNNIIILICGAVLVCVLGVIAWKVVDRPKPSKVTQSNTVTLDNHPTIEDSYLSEIRTTLDNYLKDPKSVSETLVEGLGDEKSGLKNYSNNYYESKFKVVNSKDSMAGGKEFNILFTDKPDKVFWVWVYKLAGGTYEMRGFQENPRYTPEEIKQLKPSLK
jgi:hypothetical protein